MIYFLLEAFQGRGLQLKKDASTFVQGKKNKQKNPYTFQYPILTKECFTWKVVLSASNRGADGVSIQSVKVKFWLEKKTKKSDKHNTLQSYSRRQIQEKSTSQLTWAFSYNHTFLPS